MTTEREFNKAEDDKAEAAKDQTHSIRGLIVFAVIVIGAIIGSLIGTALVARLPVTFVKKCFAVLMLIIAFKMFLSKPASPTAEPTKEQTPISEKNG